MRTIPRPVLPAAFLTALTVLASCGGSGGGAAAPAVIGFAYVANQVFAGSVSAYVINSNGALVPVAGSPFAAGLQPNSVSVEGVRSGS